MKIIQVLFYMFLLGALLGTSIHFLKVSNVISKLLTRLLKINPTRRYLYFTDTVFFIVFVIFHYIIFENYTKNIKVDKNIEYNLFIVLLSCMVTTYLIQFVYGYKYKQENLKSYFDNIRIFMYTLATLTALITFIPFKFYGSTLIAISNVYVKLFTTFIIIDVLIDLLLNKFIYNKKIPKSMEIDQYYEAIKDNIQNNE